MPMPAPSMPSTPESVDRGTASAAEPATLPSGRQARFDIEVDLVFQALVRACDGASAAAVTCCSVGHRQGVTTLVDAFAHRFADINDAGVVIVDANRQRPHWQRHLGVSYQMGVSDVLAERCSLEDAVLAVPGARGVEVMTAGVAPWPHGGLAAVNQMIDALRASGRTVVVDAGRLNDPVTLAMAAATGGAVLVVRAGRCAKPEIATAVDACRQRGVTVHGVVINRRKFYLPNWLYRLL